MKISVIGGGAWGTTLAQTLNDNNHETLIYEVNENYIDKINNEHVHPIFGNILDKKIVATNNLEEAINYSNVYLLAVPTKVMRIVLKEMNKYITKKSVFINVSKGIEPDTLKRVSEIVNDEINNTNLEGFVCLTGPSHAEEVIDRKLTVLVSASEDLKLAEKVQHLFANQEYMRIYTSTDLIGSEVGGAVKNAIAVISGVTTGLGLGENARAAVITRGIIEVVNVVKIMGGKEVTAFGLTGIGDLIVTASSENSRNFKGGKKLGEGLTMEQIEKDSNQTIEGFRTIIALNDLSEKYDIELPMINTAYLMLEGKITAKQGLDILLSRDLKEEKLD